MPNKITVLHISDMQFGKFHRFAEKNGNLSNPSDTLFARLTADLEQLAEQNQLRPDLIICTGDLAEWGMAREFTDAFAFLAKLCEHYALPRSRCIVIPGNHDVNRSNCEAYFAECKGDGTNPIFPWFPKWKHYKTAFDAFYVGFPGITFNSEIPWSLFINEDLRVVVAAFNSTMDEGHDAAVNADGREDKGHHGICTEPQYNWFKQHLGEPQFEGWLRIGAVHHNALRGCRQDDENLRDADLLGGMLEEHLHLLLHGHTHEAKAGILASSLRVYSTGSASLKTSSDNAPVPIDIPNQYQILTLQQRSITRYCRQYAPRNTPPRFMADPRQSKNTNDWIIKDDVDLSAVKIFASPTKAEDQSDGEAKTAAAPAATIPKPPAFYAEPDYLGSHNFVGRKDELQTLTDWAKPADPTNLLLFEAIGGNGKSMLTWEWTTNPKHALAARPTDSPWAGRFWYSFYERGALMSDFCHHVLAYMTGQPLEDYAKKKTAVLKDELLAQLHARPWLLILDGLERVLVAYHRIDAAEVPDEEANAPTDKIANRNPCDAIRDEDNDLLRALAAAAPSKLLVSSRLTPRVLLNPSGQPIPGAKRITLPGLRPLDAEALLRSCGIEGNSAAIQSYLTANCDNHPLVIGILGGLIANYLPARGNFDTWAIATDGGAALDLASLDLIQRRNNILRTALDALPSASRQLLSTLALLTDSVDYATLKAFNPHLPPKPEKVEKPEPPEEDWDWDDELPEEEKAKRQKQYEAALARWKNESTVNRWLEPTEFRTAPKKLEATVKDLEQRGLLQWDGRERKYDLHPVVRGVASGAMAVADRERHGQRVVDHFTAQPHCPYEEAETMEDVHNGLHIVRTLIRMGRYQNAASEYRGGLGGPLYSKLDAHNEVLLLLRPLFSGNWAILPKGIEQSDAAYLANCAGNALNAIGQGIQAVQAFESALQVFLRLEDWANACTNIAAFAAAHHGLAIEERSLRLAIALSEEADDRSGIISGRFYFYKFLARVGRWREVDEIRKTLDSTDTSYAEFPAGFIELGFAQASHLRGQPNWEYWPTVESLIKSSKSSTLLRLFHGSLGGWRLEQNEWSLAAASYQEAVRMARERSLTDATSETGLALAKHHLGHLPSPRDEAERLAQLRNPAHRYLAMLWLAISNTEQAKQHGLAAYKRAWADGEPYVYRHELIKTTELLKQLNVPIPNLPPYNPAKDESLPWEADVRTAIEKLRIEKQERERGKKQKPD